MNLIIIFISILILAWLIFWAKKHWVKKTDYTDKTEFVYHNKDSKNDHSVSLSYRIEGKGQFVFKKGKATDWWDKDLLKVVIENLCRDMVVEYGLPIKEWFPSSLKERINERLGYAYRSGYIHVKVNVTEIELNVEEMER